MLHCQAGLVRCDTAPVSSSSSFGAFGRPAASPSQFQAVGPSLFAPAPGANGAGGSAAGPLFPGTSPFLAPDPGPGSAGERAGAGAGASPAQGLGGEGWRAGPGTAPPQGSSEDRAYGSAGAGFSGGGQGLKAASGSGGGGGPGHSGAGPRSADSVGSGGAAAASRLPPLSPAGGGRSAHTLRASAASLTPVLEAADPQRVDASMLPDQAAATGRAAAGG